MMKRVTYEKAHYNENVLTQDFTFNNTKAWSFPVGSGTGATAVSSIQEYYSLGKSLKISHPQYNLNDITFRPTTSTDYQFTIPRTGKYIFSFRSFIQGTTFLPELVGGISFYVNGAGSPYITLPFNIGNNSLPTFTYIYNAWQTFFNEIIFTAGQVITFSIHLTSDATWTPGYLEFFLDAFKLEYIRDKAYLEPTIYTLPIN